MALIESLQDLLRIPSISALPEHKADCLRAAAWIRDYLPNARLVEKENCNPIVRADYCNAPGKPTLLLYGHYDVQPPDPIGEWRTPPFEPTIVGNDIFARGACDDKGQTLILLEAVRSLHPNLPINIKVLIEGEEESNGAHIEEYLPENAAELSADAVLICDTEMFAKGLPTLCTGLRGIVYGEIHVEGPAQDLHSGVYGGAAPNPLQAIARILATLKGNDGVVNIPHFYDGIQPPTPAELAAWRSLPFDQEHYRKTEVGSPALTGEAGYSVLERTWARPTFEVHGIVGGFTGAGAKTVIPAKASAKISTRLVPGQDPEAVAENLRAAIAQATPSGVTSRFELMAANEASVVDTSHPLIEKAAQALQQTFGTKTVYMRSGGSIPIVGLFRQHLGIPSVLMGFGLPDDNLHAPNEKFHLPNFYKGIEAVRNYFAVVAQ